MRNFEVERSILIRRSAEEVFGIVRDFKSWPRWSPWLCAEPQCNLNFLEDGTQYSWEGEVVGSGEMKVVGEEESKSIDLELTMSKPWKSVSQVRFHFGREGDRTRVTWSINGQLPLFLFWMAPIMAASIGFDYRRGLSMLKDFCQTGSIPSQLDFLGEGRFEGLTFVGIKTSCRIADIEEKMVADRLRLKKWIQDQHITPSGQPLSIFHKWAMVRGEATYTLGFPVEKVPGWLPEDFEGGTIPPCSVQQLRHTGPFRHLGNAWSVGISHIRARRWKQQRRIHPFEIYEKNADEALGDEMITTVYFPIAK